MVLTLTQAANEVPRLILLVSETLGRAEIGGLSAWECGRRLGISGDDEDRAELGTHVVHVADAETPQVELVELAGRGKPFDSYAQKKPQMFTFQSESRYG